MMFQGELGPEKDQEFPLQIWLVKWGLEGIVESFYTLFGDELLGSFLACSYEA